MSNVEITRQAKTLQKTRAEIKALEEKIDKLKKDGTKLELNLYNLMEAEGMTKATLDDLEIARKVTLRGSVLKHTDKDAFKYLFDSNNEDALKQHILIDLTTEDKTAVVEVLEAAGISFETSYTIHHATLSSILGQLVASGKLSTEDFEKYSIWVQNQVTVKQVK